MILQLSSRSFILNTYILVRKTQLSTGHRAKKYNSLLFDKAISLGEEMPKYSVHKICVCGCIWPLNAEATKLHQKTHGIWCGSDMSNKAIDGRIDIDFLVVLTLTFWWY